MQRNELADEENNDINRGLVEGLAHLSKFIKRERLSGTRDGALLLVIPLYSRNLFI